MNLFRNAKIKTKIFLTVMLADVIYSSLNILVISRLRATDATYSNLITEQTNALLAVSEAKDSLERLRVTLRDYWMYRDNDRIAAVANANEAYYQQFLSTVYHLKNLTFIDAREATDRIISAAEDYYDYTTQVHTLVSTGNYDEALLFLETTGLPSFEKIVTEMQNFYMESVNHAELESTNITQDTLAL